VDGDLLALDGLGAGARFQDLLLESHLPVIRVSSPQLRDGTAALVLLSLTGGGATYISGYIYFCNQYVHPVIYLEYITPGLQQNIIFESELYLILLKSYFDQNIS
jgi:hypothetical protein